MEAIKAKDKEDKAILVEDKVENVTTASTIGNMTRSV
jgi:hypothetical protein